jgi:hypothetical protein
MKNFNFTIVLVVFGFSTSFAGPDPDKKPTKFRILAISALEDLYNERI